MNYEQGFSDGEKAAFRDRKVGFVRAMPDADNEYRRGFVDGYRPRSITWALRPTKAAGWWREKSEVVSA
jgi:hypothetical protein